MNISGAKTAIILGLAIVIGVAAISIGLGTLDMQVSDTSTSDTPRIDSTESENNIQPQQASIDKSRFKITPKLVGIADYINTSPEDLQNAMKDKVILYDIWTYSCVNCIRTLPYITAWDEKYSDQGLLIIGIHSPEFEFEKETENVKRAVAKYDINYPVVLDNDMETWSAFENRYWPRKYIADHEGYIRYDHIGEGGYKESERKIQELLLERSIAFGMEFEQMNSTVDIDEFVHTNGPTPEIYFGYKLALPNRNYLANSNGFSPNNIVSYVLPTTLTPNSFHMGGDWHNGKDGMSLISESGDIVLPFYAKEVNIVASGNASLSITLDGNVIPEIHAGMDVMDGLVDVSDARLYNIISSPNADEHILKISTSSPGFEIFTFTFG
ncbi:MAG: Redoxin domain-containing protein [Cenarchaeum symbiont of Oopsacas minuta]|nr:Redoxin domain-containing protein [Cenarchaeum symbiont of Oopsacas minuta]